MCLPVPGDKAAWDNVHQVARQKLCQKCITTPPQREQHPGWSQLGTFLEVNDLVADSHCQLLTFCTPYMVWYFYVNVIVLFYYCTPDCTLKLHSVLCMHLCTFGAYPIAYYENLYQLLSPTPNF